MLCPLYESIGNGKCYDANKKHIYLYDGGDCQRNILNLKIQSEGGKSNF